MIIVRPGDPLYDKDRVISNARFIYSPQAIYYCQNTDDVVWIVNKSRNDRVPVRIRSGGHQHEGMCTANGVNLIDLSLFKTIFPVSGGLIQIGAGAKLNDVYATLWRNGYLFSGGGCGDVRVGGLTQGGGWGPQSRKLGLTCDSLAGCEIVKADGQTANLSQDNPQDLPLLTALRGGGGGNFGVVTNYYFRQHPWPGDLISVTLTWRDQDLPGAKLDQFILNWVRAFPRDGDENLTTFLRLSAIDAGGERVVIGGRYIGGDAQARSTMTRLLAGQPPPYTADYKPIPRLAETAAEGSEEWEGARLALGTLPGYQPGPPVALEGAAPGAPGDLSDTCAGVSIRHKISSGFARPSFDLAAIQQATRSIRSTPARSDARQYLSFHCLGGAIREDRVGTSFAFRGRDVLLQFQAWWQPSGIDGYCIDWIERFRLDMAPYTDGAFINFVDRLIPLSEYYKDKLPFLSGIKRSVDPNNFFRFEMSIPF